MLEAQRLPDGEVQLLLYSQPGATVRIEWASELPATPDGWTTLLHTNPVGLTTSLAPIPANAPVRFFRAVRP